MLHITLQDKISRGYGNAARAIGELCDLYRPQSATDPLNGRNHILRFYAGFLPYDGRVRMPTSYGHVTWQGVFDAAYTQPGDFIVGPLTRSGAQDAAIWFIAAQQPLLPPLCVRTSALIDVVRSSTSTTVGAGSYGGVGALSSITILSACPASIIHASGVGLNPLGLPATVAPGDWEVLLPAASNVVLRTNDRIFDDLGRSASIAAAERSDLGWRVIAKEIAS